MIGNFWEDKWEYENFPYFVGYPLLADNCGGQKKNEDVFRFLMWLVEVHVFLCMEDMFFIKGHNKNACDRMFNFLKLYLRLCNICCFDGMVHYLDDNGHISVEPIASDEFFHFHRLLNSFYRTLGMGQTNRTCVFKIISSLPKTLQKHDVTDSDFRFDSFLPKKK